MEAVDEILEFGLALLRQCQRHMAVRPNHIRRVALEPCIRRRFVPGEGVDGKTALPACSCESLFLVAVNMDLPIQRPQWSEVVQAGRAHPRQTVSAFHFSRFALAEWTFRIVNPRLRYDSKHRSA